MKTTTTFRRSSLALLLLLVTEVLADDDDTDFLMNVFSDLGPVLALFGEQFARQFLSETFTWYDHLIFACVPLGIMTAIAGAIRVEGRPVLKAFIGRARENKAAAEIEYMSSTSAEVGELFNGRGIVRTMGQSKIAQFIVFRNDFGSNKTTHGIHTLKSATEKNQNVLKREDYRDELDVRFMKWFKQDKTQHTSQENQLEGGTNNTSSSKNTNNKISSKNYWDSLQYPNLQLNIAAQGITAKQRSAELHLAAISAVILQASLLAIAAVIPYRVSGFEQQPWGLPCYIGGSILLISGMLACSVAIERSTKEYKWYPHDSRTEKKEHMNLFWVQGKQRVSDQEFGSFIIYAEDKEYMSTSSRKEDVGDKSNDRDDQNEASNQQESTIQTQEDFSQTKKIPAKKSGEKFAWYGDIRAVTALLAGGAGFTIQFIGLRGLPWPVAVAHLGALIIMAIIRALVRRRLGEDTRYREVQSEYELDYLATLLVKNKGYITSHSKRDTESLQEIPQEALWRVVTAEYGNGTISSFDFRSAIEPGVVCPKQTNQNALSPASVDQHHKDSNGDDLKTMAQKLISVRKRLGDLCKWETKAFKPGLTLVHSIEHFLDEFAPEELSSNNLITWRIPMKSSVDKSGIVELEIIREDTRWKINAGEVEAVLSIWMAYLEANNTTQTQKNKDTEWQRSKAGVALGVDYYRILGRSYDDGVLQRDIDWWVGNPAITEIEAKEKAPEASSNHQRKSGCTTSVQPRGTIVANQSSSRVSSPQQITPIKEPHVYDCSKHKNVKIVIGCTAPADANGPQKIYVQHSTAALATIAVQHLFTHFIWTIADLLPKDVLGQGSINIGEFVSDASSSKPGIDRKLKHEKLEKFTLRAGKEGLGTSDDILLCIIPVFSIKDFLPNDAITEFKLLKLTERKNWPKAAARFSDLLRSMPKSPDYGLEDSLTLTAVVRALDYLYLMALDEKYSRVKKPTETNTESKQPGIDKTEDSSTKPNIPQSRPKPTGEGSVEELQSLIFNVYSGAIEKLWPFYKLQRREEFFLDLKDNCEERMPKKTSPLKYGIQQRQKFMQHIRFTKLHQEVVNTRQLDLGELQGKKIQTRDIFGWTALHYAAACRDLKIIGGNTADKASLSGVHRPKNWWLDNFGRSPIHIASLTGNSKCLETLLKIMSEDDVQSTLQLSGPDGMNPVHLAVTGGHKECLYVFLKLLNSFGLELKHDAWKRSPAHLALAQGQYSCATALLENEDLKFKPTALDILGKSPLSYLDEKVHEQKEIGHLLLTTHSEKFEDKDNDGNTVWHHAVRFIQHDSWINIYGCKLMITLRKKHLSTINAANRAHETALYLAVQGRNDALAEVLLDMDADPSTNKNKHQSPLMLACTLGRLDIVDKMLKKPMGAATDQDRKGKFALHYVVESKDCDNDICHAIVRMLVQAMKDADLKSVDVKDNNGMTPLHFATHNANGLAVSELLDSGADPSTRDRDDYNALHYAVLFWLYNEESSQAMQDITRRLLEKAPNCMNACNCWNNTPFTMACSFGKPLNFISQVVHLSNQKGSKINLNYPDERWGQSPLAWACEENKKDVVTILLKSTTVDLSQKSTGRSNYTPLHHALEQKNHEIVEMLVRNPERRADINAASSSHSNILEFAYEKSDPNCMKTLLSHPDATSPPFLNCTWKRAVQKYLHEKNMVWFVNEWEAAILEPKNNVPFPFHDLVEVGQTERFQSLVDEKKLHHDFDNDGWTPADVAVRYGHVQLAYRLRQNEPARDFSVNPYVEPSTFVSLFKGAELEFSECPCHQQCSDRLLNVKLPKNDRLDKQFCYLRTKEAIPPNLGFFYFEVKILRSLQMKECVIGFCGRDVPENRLPGWDEGSFAYHGDDGSFCVSGDYDAEKSEDKFDQGDVVGCGLNFETGQGYRTKNGVLLGSSSQFKNTKFSTGRFYPCIGARTDDEGDEFQVQVTLRSSSEHPFHYKGPYDGLLLRTEWDDENPPVTSPSQASDADSEDESKDG